MLKRIFVSFLLSLGIPVSSVEPGASHPFRQFLDAFIPKVSSKAKQVNKAFWLLETTGSPDAADLVASLSAESALLFNDLQTYQQLLAWDKDPAIQDPVLKRQLNVLIRSFKANAIPEDLLREIAEKEAALSLAYSNFRATLQGKTVSENEILDRLKNEQDPSIRKETWAASKQIGSFLAPKILELVCLRNKAAKSLGYKNYFEMQLDLQEVDEKALFTLLNNLASQSDEIYTKTIQTIQELQAKRFSVSVEELGPWAWSEPFCQEDPINTAQLDSLVSQTDLSDAGLQFYQRMGIDVEPILKRSDMFERPGKNQHAFCINIDRTSDVRTLNNVKPTIKWLETVFHELGHGVYELGLGQDLPWLLRSPPHMITTEAMALLAGRRAYLRDSLSKLSTYSSSQDALIEEAEESLKRRQLIFSRWVLVMTYFEKALYENPDQDLNGLWWSLVAKYQKINPPKEREGKQDWAAKYHIGLAPVYYYSYLLGELFASEIEVAILKATGSKELETSKAGLFLQEKLFAPGDLLPWAQLTEQVSGHPLSAEAWLSQFVK
jgi:peptidyl-dipeptidase A